VLTDGAGLPSAYVEIQLRLLYSTLVVESPIGVFGLGAAPR